MRKNLARTGLTVLLLMLGVGGALAVTATAQNAGPPARTASGALPATIRIAGGGRRIPKGFFGLSMELNEVPSYEREGALFDRVLAMIRPHDGGPLMLRVGGKSADHTLWSPSIQNMRDQKKLPAVWKIGPQWLTGLAQFVRAEDIRVILSLNLVVHSSSMASAFAQAAARALPRGSLAGLEIGNEPNEYHYQPDLARERIPSTSPGTRPSWWENYSPGDYRRDYIGYARTLKARLPHVELGAPDIDNADVSWLSPITGLGRLDPGFLAIHRYASSYCWPKNAALYPSIPVLLGENQSAGLAAGVKGAVAFAHAHHMALRVTEFNSISCGGNPGVANSFASALWAPDALFETIDAGVDGISLHLRLKSINTPFEVTPTGITTRPELYAFALFSQMTHGPATLLGTSVSGSSRLHLKAWAVRKGRTINVLLINKGPVAAEAALPVHGRGPALVRRLTAPGPAATGGVRFAGMYIGADARWHGRAVEPRVSATGGAYHVLVPGYSEALVTL